MVVSARGRFGAGGEDFYVCTCVDGVARMGTKKKRISKRLSSRKFSQSKETSINLFEVRVNRKKHDILGQRLKSDRGLPGISRSKAIQKVCHCVGEPIIKF